MFQPSGPQLLANNHALRGPFQPDHPPRQSELIIYTQLFLLGLRGLGCGMHFQPESLAFGKPRGCRYPTGTWQGGRRLGENERKEEAASVLARPCFASSGGGRGRVASRLHQSGSEEEEGPDNPAWVSERKASRKTYRAFVQIKLYVQRHTITCSAEVENGIFL